MDIAIIYFPGKKGALAARGGYVPQGRGEENVGNGHPASMGKPCPCWGRSGRKWSVGETLRRGKSLRLKRGSIERGVVAKGERCKLEQ